ncbi:hypothetical protein ALT1644_50006 [Alteromonas macleodii]
MTCGLWTPGLGAIEIEGQSINTAPEVSPRFKACFFPAGYE